MDNQLQTLFEFLDQFGPEVRGNSVAEPDTGVAVLLERFAAGRCEAPERADICRLLQANPHWLRWVGSRIKGAREKSLQQR